MFESNSDKFPLVDITTAGGWRVIIGPCAARLILRIFHIGLIVLTLLFFGGSLGKELTVLLQAFGV